MWVIGSIDRAEFSVKTTPRLNQRAAGICILAGEARPPAEEGLAGHKIRSRAARFGKGK